MSGVVDVGDGVPQALARAVSQLLHAQAAEGQPSAQGSARHVATPAKVDAEHQAPVSVDIRTGQLAGTVGIRERIAKEGFLRTRQGEARALVLYPARGVVRVEPVQERSAPEEQGGDERREQHRPPAASPSMHGTAPRKSLMQAVHGPRVPGRGRGVCRRAALRMAMQADA